MIDDELNFSVFDKFNDTDYINELDIERSSLVKDADDYSERELLRETLIKNGWVKL